MYCDNEKLGKVLQKYLKYILSKNITNALGFEPFALLDLVMFTTNRISNGIYYGTPDNFNGQIVVDLGQTNLIAWIAKKSNILNKLPKVNIPYCLQSKVMGLQLQTLLNKDLIMVVDNQRGIIIIKLLDSNKFVSLFINSIDNPLEVYQLLIVNNYINYIIFDIISDYKLFELPECVECSGNLKLRNLLCKYIGRTMLIGLNQSSFGNPELIPIELVEVNSYLILGHILVTIQPELKFIIIQLNNVQNFTLIGDPETVPMFRDFLKESKLINLK